MMDVTGRDVVAMKHPSLEELETCLPANVAQ